ncbi:hypothetical protein [Rubellicoccus peritrichatus]|uniref:SHOCT domain-containing protein n=1 Tax=Rubellicoccus peritrichatus TaxID=3080537 RepID=A0AAQ3LBZ3_9BACT|nr:hypothetical protein [Puniceicoccus sp. CR14]WOO41065.1 hypothetical protein RZN69_20795 [Puniceicoccus sp. CR14]
MYSIKPGRAPSALGAVMGVVVVIFGIGWTIIAVQMSHVIPVIGFILPLFGVVFVIAGIIVVIYNLRNATAKNRFSAMDITSGREELDPLNQMFGIKRASSQEGEEDAESRLKELDQLRAKNIISENEYKKQREQIISDI